MGKHEGWEAVNTTLPEDVKGWVELDAQSVLEPKRQKSEAKQIFAETQQGILELRERRRLLKEQRNAAIKVKDSKLVDELAGQMLDYEMRIGALQTRAKTLSKKIK